MEADYARQLLTRRRERDAALGAELFSDPAWDMLLALFVAADGGKALSAADLVTASSTSRSTGLRRIQDLAKSGHVLSSEDPEDGRKMRVSLSPKGERAMRKLLKLWIERDWKEQ